MADLPPLAGEHHVCDECALDYDLLPVPQAVAGMARDVESLVALLRATPDEALRRAPAGSWTAIEYACHVRDVLVTYAVRLHRGLLEDRPSVDPLYNDWRAARFRYAQAPVGDLVRALRSGSEGLSAEVEAVPENAWDRTVTRRPEEVRSLRWLVRQAAHEVRHHLRDVRRIVAGQDA